MGGWSTDWEYEYRALQGIPTIEKEGNRWFIIILPKVGFMITKNMDALPALCVGREEVSARAVQQGLG